MSVETVRWLQPPRYVGVEETISRSRVRRGGQLIVGEEVRVRYKRCFYKAKIINVDGQQSTALQHADVASNNHHLASSRHHPFPDVHPAPPVTAVSPLPHPAVPSPGTMSPLAASTPLQASLPVEDALIDPGFQHASLPEDIPSFGELPWQETSIASQMNTPLPQTWVSWMDSETAASTPTQGAQMGNHLMGYESTSTTISTPTLITRILEHEEEDPENDLHECIDQQMLDDLVLSVNNAPQLHPSRSAVENFANFLFSSHARIQNELFPRVSSVLEEMEMEGGTRCERCIGRLRLTLRRLMDTLQHLTALMEAAARNIVAASEE